jgi:hypothetical protein
MEYRFKNVILTFKIYRGRRFGGVGVGAASPNRESSAGAYLGTPVEML